MIKKNETEQLCWRIIVSGRVQGVYFRAFARKQAVQLGLTGHAKNLVDGDVEIIACGSEAALKQFMDGCRKGPLLAKVQQLTVTPLQTTQQFSSFTIS